MNNLKYKILDKIYPEYKKLEKRSEKLIYFRKLFNKFIDKQIVVNLMDTEFTTDGTIKDICVMFTDVRGFTSFSEKTSLRSSNSFLNNFYDIVIENTQTNGGIIDKFLGDGTMSIFGVYDSKSDYTTRAVESARLIMKDFIDMTSQKDEPSLFLGIGITKGESIVGTFGNGNFVSFTAIGNTVNLASRVQGVSNNNEILITKEVAAGLNSKEYKRKGVYHLKNVSKSVELFKVI